MSDVLGDIPIWGVSEAGAWRPSLEYVKIDGTYDVVLLLETFMSISVEGRISVGTLLWLVYCFGSVMCSTMTEEENTVGFHNLFYHNLKTEF